MRSAAGLLVLAIAAALLPVPNTVIERLYASRVFPAIQIVLTSLSNQVPFALFDVLVAAVGGWFLVGTARDVVTVRRKESAGTGVELHWRPGDRGHLFQRQGAPAVCLRGWS